MSQPFISFYTPTFRRPHGLRRCMESVQAQTAIQSIEHIVIPDHLGVGIGGMFQRVQQYTDAVHGQYVHILADDDELASPDVVSTVSVHAGANQYPPVIIVGAQKAHLRLPDGPHWPPRLCHIDLGCIITRADVWKAHAKDYGHRYEGDYDFAASLWNAGYDALLVDVLFLRDGVSRGEAEIAA